MSPLIGISPDVGVGKEKSGECEEFCPAMGESPERKAAWVAGESCGARWDLRLSLSNKPTAHSFKSTGVRFAACTKGSRS